VAAGAGHRAARLTPGRSAGTADERRNEPIHRSVSAHRFTPEQKKAATRAAWQKKRDELSATERVGQNDDAYLLPESAVVR